MTYINDDVINVVLTVKHIFYNIYIYEITIMLLLIILIIIITN